MPSVIALSLWEGQNLDFSCHTLQHTFKHWEILEHTAAHFKTLQRTAVCCSRKANYLSLLHKSPIKETIFCKRAL